MSKSSARARWRTTFGAAALGALFSACGGGAGADTGGGTGVPTPASIAFSAPSLIINNIASSATTTATVRDASGATLSGASIAWSVDQPNVASISGAGNTATLTARERGVAQVTARAGNLSASITVFVRAAAAMTVTPTEISFRVGNTAPLQAFVTADEGAATTVTWSSSAPTIASVSSQGVVTGVTAGTAVITARSVSDTRLSATATITVAPPRSVIMTPTEMNIGRAESRALSAQVFVDAGVSTAVIWRTNRPLIATVNQQGVATGVSDGDATITAIAVADTTLRASALVRVVPVVRSIVVAPLTTTLNVAQTQPFTTTIVADQGVSAAVQWSSSNSAVASVNAQGLTTAIGVGTATIRVRAVSDSTRVATATVIVNERPVALTLGASTLGLTIGRTSTVSAVVTGDPGIPTTVQWTSRNTAVASVNALGLVTGLAQGTTYLVAQANADATKRDSVRVTVVSQLATAWSTARIGGPLIEDIVSLWASSATVAYAVNSLGDVYRWDGSTWTSSARGSQFGTVFTAVHGVSSGAILAVGTNGVIARFNGSSWSPMISGTSAVLQDVWMYDSDGAWAVGAGGTVLRLVDGAWNAMNSGTTTRLRGVWGSSAIAYAVGDGGEIRRFQTGNWQLVASGTPEVLHGVWASADGVGSVFAVGEFGTILRWNGSAFERETSGTQATLLRVAGSANGAALVTGDGVALQRVQGAWADQSPPYRTRFSAAAIDASGGMWVGGQRGLVMRAPATGGWATLSLTPDLLDVWSSSASHAIAVGELGFIFRYDGTNWTRQAAPTLERLNTVWAASANNAFVGGDNGMLLHWNGSTWTEHTSPTSDHVYAMWGSSSSSVWAVTDAGEILFFDGTSWTVAHTQSQPLYGVYGTASDDVHAVGQAGTSLHWNGATWSTRSTNSSHVLVGLWASDSSHAFSVGARDFSSGVAMRFNGAWSEVTAGTSNILSAIWGAVEFDLYAVGDMGTIVRYNGTGWVPMISGTTEFLWAVSGAPDATGAGFAVGLNGVVVQGQASGGAASAMRTASGVRAAPPRANLAPMRGATRQQDTPLPFGRARKRLNGGR